MHGWKTLSVYSVKDLTYNQTHNRLHTVGQEINMSEIRCNRCGRIIVFGDMHNKEDYVLIQKEWGYFSRKDGRKYTLRMCEDCYDRLVNECVIPPEIDDVTEYA